MSGSDPKSVKRGSANHLTLTMLALVIVTVATSAISHTSAWGGVGFSSLGPGFVTVGAAVLLLCVTVLVGLAVSVLRRRRHKRADDDYEKVVEDRPVPLRTQIGLTLAAIGLLVIAAVVPIVLGHLSLKHSTVATPSQASPTVKATTPDHSPAEAPPTTGPSTGPRNSSSSVAGVGLVILTVGLGVALIAVPAVAWQRRRRDVRALSTVPVSAPAPTLAVIDAGVTALAGPETPRAAILACYRAMESSLATAGTRRTDAETPTELLTRVARQGLVMPASAIRLAELFAEARFSDHSMTAAQQDEARLALASIRVALERTEPIS